MQQTAGHEWLVGLRALQCVSAANSIVRSKRAHRNVKISGLNSAEREIVVRCLSAAVEDPFFDEEEFHTLFGLFRQEVSAVIARWPEVNDTDEDAKLAVNNALLNLLEYPHDEGLKELELVGATDAELERILRKLGSTGLA